MTTMRLQEGGFPAHYGRIRRLLTSSVDETQTIYIQWSSGYDFEQMGWREAVIRRRRATVVWDDEAGRACHILRL